MPSALELLCTPPECAISRTNLLPIVIAFLAGTIAAFQAFISGELTKALDDGLWAGFISNLGALIFVCFFLVSNKFRVKLGNFFRDVKRSEIRPWWLMGGAFGALYVASSSLAVAILGTGVFTIGVVAGANVTSLIVDKLGFGSEKQYSISRIRIFAALLAVGAVTLASLNQINQLTLFALLMVLLAGVSQIFQLSFNSNLAKISTAQVATFINFPIAIFFGAIFIFMSMLIGESVPSFPQEIWLYSAGLLGGVFVLIAAWLVKKLGVLVFTLTTISGQLFASLIIDYAFIGINLGWQIFAGSALVLVAVYLASELR